DVFFFDNAYQEAVDCYKQVTSLEYRQKVFHNQLYSLFELKDYNGVLKTAAGYFKETKVVKPEEKLSLQLFFAESLYNESKNIDDEQKKALFYTKAKQHYQDLLHTKFHLVALFPLAEIHRYLKEYDKAVPYYLQLAEKYPSEREDLYLQAALTQMHNDSEAAIESFARIEGKHAGIATYHQMALLYQAKKYEAILEIDKERQKAIPDDRSALASFFMGRSHYILKNYPQAASFLRQSLSFVFSNPEEKKASLLSLILCAKELKDLSLLDKTIDQFERAFPADAQTPKIKLLHAQLALEKGSLDIAINDLQEILDHYPAADSREKVVYDLAVLLTRAEQWEKSRALFLSYLKDFPAGSETRSVWRHIANCSLQQYKNSPSDETQMLFAQDVKGLLGQEEALTAKESQEYRFLLVKVLYDLKEYQDAAAQLTTYLVDYADHPTFKEASFLSALCDTELAKDPQAYIDSAEKALAINPEFEGRGVLHLKLFNAYLTLSKNDKAAENLFESISLGYGEVKRENQIWLGDYFYKEFKSSPENTQAKKCALEVYKNLFTTIDLALEAETLKYVELLEDCDQKIALLQKLLEAQDQHPTEPWKFQRLALFQMAEAYEASNNVEKALETYELLITTSAYAPSYLSKAALLQKARLQYAHMRPEQKTENDPLMREVLNTLKDLQAVKKSSSEPLHIQAAIEYAKIKAELSPDSGRLATTLYFLNRVKEDFDTADYIATFSACEEKRPLFDSYLNQVETEISELKQMIAELEQPEAQNVAAQEQETREEVTAGDLPNPVTEEVQVEGVELAGEVAASEAALESMEEPVNALEGLTPDLHE
ncbi:MAG TPA: tetratricopeptide repeat protein, partial [Rhabdochlamydiaceae bacterium]